jgi:hypothetical protein
MSLPGRLKHGETLNKAMSCPCHTHKQPISLALPSLDHHVQYLPLQSMITTQHGPGSRKHGIGQAARAQNHARACQARGERALDAPEHRSSSRLRPPPATLPLRRAPPPSPLPRRHAREPAAALSPSSSSKKRRGYRSTRYILLIGPIVLSQRQQHAKHRHAAAHQVLYAPCPFARRRCRAVDALSQH